MSLLPIEASAADARSGFDRVSLVMTALTALLLALPLSLLFVVQIPALWDYVNHLAGMYILAGPPNLAYAVKWRLSPNMAMDLVVPVLARWTGAAAAGRLFLGASQILLVSGSVFLEWAVKGRHRIGGLGALLVLFSLPFAWGFMNFMFGMGVAVWGVGLWVWVGDRGALARWAVHAALVALLYISHVYALGVYGLTIGLYELSRLRQPFNAPALVRLGIFVASPAVAVMGLAALFGAGPGAWTCQWLPVKAYWLVRFMSVYDLRLSVAMAAALLALAYVLWREHRLVLGRAGLWIGGGFAAVYVLAPQNFLDGSDADIRMLTAAGLILPAFVSGSRLTGPWRAIPLALVLGVILTGEAMVAYAWLDDQADYREISATFPLLRPGSAVLVGTVGDDDGRRYQPLLYAPTLAAPASGVFVSSLFSQSGLAPIEPRPAFRALALPELDAAPLPISRLLKVAAGNGAAPGPLRRWPQTYQYLYLIGPPGPDPAPDFLTRIASGRRFALYRIGRAKTT